MSGDGSAPGTSLRRVVLAVSVLDDLPVRPLDTGVVLGERPGPVLTVTWDDVERVLAGADPEAPAARYRLRQWMTLRLEVEGLGGLAGFVLRRRAVLHALPPAHATHPGPAWTRQEVPGRVLDLGVALRDVLGDGTVTPLPPDLADRLGLDLDRWWPGLVEHAEHMGSLAVDRLRRDGKGLLSPVGGCDVLTLLASGRLRAHLAAGDGTGMRALAVPMRDRGWFDLARIDPAFVGAAWTATDPDRRGLPRPLLVTADGVHAAPDAGDGRQQVLRDPAADDDGNRDVLYR